MTNGRMSHFCSVHRREVGRMGKSAPEEPFLPIISLVYDSHNAIFRAECPASIQRRIENNRPKVSDYLTDSVGACVN